MPTKTTLKLLLVAGARPNFMKIAPLVRAFKKIRFTDFKIVHTGQHYDYSMSKAFFEDLELPKPDYFLNAGSGSHAYQTAHIMTRFEKVCQKEKPYCIVVVGDVNSTMACAVAAKKLHIKVAHVEAGLRSRDMSMPEEINRIITDSVSDYLFTTEEEANKNLLREGISKKNIFFAGQVMIDNLCYQMKKLKQANENSFPTKRLKNRLKKYIYLTLHRPANVDKPESLKKIFSALNRIASNVPIIFSVHPRTRKNLKRFHIKISPNIHLLEPLRFNESLFLWKDALAVLTDSGGLQEETTARGIPCLTLRENTERPVTVKKGTNIVVGTNPEKILREFKKIVNGKFKKGRIPDKWDGKSAERIVNILTKP